MTDNLNVKLQNIPYKKLIIGLVIITFVSDLILLDYMAELVKTRILDPTQLNIILHQKGIMFSSHELTNFHQLMVNTAKLIFVFIIIYNTFFYIMAVLLKKWAIKYLSFYTLSAVILSILELGLSTLSKDLSFSFVTLGTAFSYGFIYYTLKLRKAEL